MSLVASQVTMGNYHPVRAVTPGKWTSVHRTGNCWARHTMLIEYIKFKPVFLHDNKRRPLKEWWLWLGYLGMMPGASVSNSAHDKGHEEGGFGICKGGIEPQETPCSQAPTPKTRVCLHYCFMLSPTPLTLWGAVPHRFSRRRSKRAAPRQ